MMQGGVQGPFNSQNAHTAGHESAEQATLPVATPASPHTIILGAMHSTPEQQPGTTTHTEPLFFGVFVFLLFLGTHPRVYVHLGRRSTAAHGLLTLVSPDRPQACDPPLANTRQCA